MNNVVRDLCVLKRFGATCRPRWALIILKECWLPPNHGWVKLNIDGAWNSGSGYTDYGGLFRNSKSLFFGAFCSNLKIPSSVGAELIVVIKAIELALVQDWN